MRSAFSPRQKMDGPFARRLTTRRMGLSTAPLPSRMWVLQSQSVGLAPSTSPSSGAAPRAGRASGAVRYSAAAEGSPASRRPGRHSASSVTLGVPAAYLLRVTSNADPIRDARRPTHRRPPRGCDAPGIGLRSRAPRRPPERRGPTPGRSEPGWDSKDCGDLEREGAELASEMLEVGTPAQRFAVPTGDHILSGPRAAGGSGPPGVGSMSAPTCSREPGALAEQTSDSVPCRWKGANHG
jgi:hypothetical protein